jgi:hypothetical protein
MFSGRVNRVATGELGSQRLSMATRCERASWQCRLRLACEEVVLLGKEECGERQDMSGTARAGIGVLPRSAA